MWFKDLMGFEELSPENVRDKISIDGKQLVSKVNGKSYRFGDLEVPELSVLRKRGGELTTYSDRLVVSEVVGNVQDFHCFKENSGAVFQAASQFNLLEMVAPSVKPEAGVGIYETDYTQGPACAIACGAGTIYRNYFAPVNGEIGQTANNQIDCLDEIGKVLNNKELKLWDMRNGYAMLTTGGLEYITEYIERLTDSEREALKGKLKIGIQWDTEVTLMNDKNRVTQTYCSALPIAYCHIHTGYWESFARLILEATYEATFYTALLNYNKTGNNKLFLTLVGGGAFGNRGSWILESLEKVLAQFKNTPLDVKMISYGSPHIGVQELLEKFK